MKQFGEFLVRVVLLSFTLLLFVSILVAGAMLIEYLGSTVPWGGVR